MMVDLGPHIEAVDRSGSGVSTSGGTPIGVLHLRRVENGGNLRALASVRIGCLKIHGWRIVQQPGQRAWVSVPQEQGSDGRWHNRLEVTNPAVLEAIRATVLQAWEAGQ